MEEANETRENRSKGRMIIIITSIVLFVLFMGGLIPRVINNFEINAIASKNPLPQVTVMRLEPNTKPIELILPSSAQAWHITPIWSRVNGYLINFYHDIGDMVKEGDLLADIDTPETDQQLAQAEADLLNSQAARDIAKITSDRWQALWDKNREAVSKQEVDQFNANLLSAEALVVANEKNVARLKYQQQFKYIYAPFDGVITKRLIDIGSLIYGTVNGNAQELFEIAQTNTMRFFTDVPQTYFTNIKDGLEAEVTIGYLPGQVFKGSVTRFAKALDPNARTLTTEVDVENKEHILYPGLYGMVKFFLIPDTINFIIPTTALIIRSGYPHVAVIRDNNFVHLSQVQIGRDYGNKVEIISGLKENDLIVVIPNDRIHEGVKVEIINGPKQENKKKDSNDGMMLQVSSVNK